MACQRGLRDSKLGAETVGRIQSSDQEGHTKTQECHSNVFCTEGLVGEECKGLLVAVGEPRNPYTHDCLRNDFSNLS